jgi:hypothetical protein
VTRRKSGGLSPENTKAGRYQRALLKQMEIHRDEGTVPTNGRFLFYELEQLGVLPKVVPGQVRPTSSDLNEQLTSLREWGLILWSEVRDERREYTSFRTAPTVAQAVIKSVDSASLDRWGGKPAPLILCESEAVYGAMYPSAARYACPITHTSGQARAHLINEVAPNLKRDQHILYLGDWDLAGGQIEEHTLNTLIEFAGRRTPSVPVRRLTRQAWERSVRDNWERLALTEAQVDDPELDLRRLVIRKVDRRYKEPRTFDAVELEALGQARIVALVRARLDELMLEATGETLDGVLGRQDQQRAEVAEQLRRLIGDEQ